MKFWKLFYIVGISALLFSCSGGEKNKLADQIPQKWVLNGKSSESITFSPDKSFSSSLNSKNFFKKGTWEAIDNKNSKTLIINEAVSEKTNTVDSVLIKKDSVILFNKKKNVAILHQGKVKQITKKQTFKVITISDELLVLEQNDTKYDFYAEKDNVALNLDFMGILRGFIGLLALVLIAFLFSKSRKNIDWRLVITGLSMQLILAVLVLKVPIVRDLFDIASSFFVKVLDFTYAGSSFLFGNLISPEKMDTFGFIFAFQVLPTIIFFSALTSGLYYLGILQKVVYAFAWIMKKTMRLSGAESLSAAGNIFLGQTEAPLLVKPYVNKMTFSELMTLMTGGMATIAGGVLAAYVGFLGKGDPMMKQMFATHLLTASVMSAPAAVVFAKMLVPETSPEKINTELNISKQKIGVNLIDALSNGTIDGLKLAVNVGAMLIAFIALIALVNYAFTDIIGAKTGLNDYIAESTDGKFKGFSLEYIFGQIFRPIAYVMGVDWKDSLNVGSLLGVKTVVNEFVAYKDLGVLEPGAISEKSRIISTYALCGFANFSSIAIQIGGIGAFAPKQRPNLSRLGLLSVLGGTLASFSTATIAGMFVG